MDSIVISEKTYSGGQKEGAYYMLPPLMIVFRTVCLSRILALIDPAPNMLN